MFFFFYLLKCKLATAAYVSNASLLKSTGTTMKSACSHTPVNNIIYGNVIYFFLFFLIFQLSGCYNSDYVFFFVFVIYLNLTYRVEVLLQSFSSAALALPPINKYMTHPLKYMPKPDNVTTAWNHMV